MVICDGGSFVEALVRKEQKVLSNDWSSRDIGWTTLDASSSSRGILIMWNDPSFQVSYVTLGSTRLLSFSFFFTVQRFG